MWEKKVVFNVIGGKHKIEPMYGEFATYRLDSWVPKRERASSYVIIGTDALIPMVYAV